MQSSSTHRLLIPAGCVVAGILASGYDHFVPVVFVVAGLVGWGHRRDRRIMRGLIVCAILGALGWFSAAARFYAGVSSGDAVCVGHSDGAVLTGRCLQSRTDWYPARVALIPRTQSTKVGFVAVQGRLEPHGPRRNPGERDPVALGRLLGTHGTLRFRVGPQLLRVGRNASLVPMRRSFVDRQRRLFGSDLAGNTIISMFAGERSTLPSSVFDRFRDAGLSHLLAISGFHVGLIGFGFFAAARGLLGRLRLGPAHANRWLCASTLAVVSAYALLTGGAASTVRSAIMAGLLLSRRLVGRPSFLPRQALFLAVMIYLALQPGALYGAGLPLSALAVYGIVSDAGPDGRLVTVSFCAILFTLPVVGAFFGSFAPVGLLSNVFAMPVAAVVVTGAAVTNLLDFASTAASAPIAVASRFLAELLVEIASLAAMAPGLRISPSTAPLLAFALIAGRVPGTAAGRRWVSGMLAVVVLGASSVRVSGPLRITFLDVGHGDAILVETPAHRMMLVDVGPPHAVGAVLRAVNRTKANFAVITHDHRDHAGGLVNLLRRLHADSLLASSSAVEPDRVIGAGDVIHLEKDVRVYVLGPERGTTKINETSVVLLLVHGSVRMLLLGDAEFASERDLVRRWGTLLQADVVKIAHHGSPSSSHPFFVERVARRAGKARWGIVSVDRKSRFGLPSKRVLSRWASAGYHVLTTASSGAVQCTSDGLHAVCSSLHNRQLSR